MLSDLEATGGLIVVALNCTGGVGRGPSPSIRAGETKEARNGSWGRVFRRWVCGVMNKIEHILIRIRHVLTCTVLSSVVKNRSEIL